MKDWMLVAAVTGFFFIVSLYLHAEVAAALGDKTQTEKTGAVLIENEAAEGMPAVVGRAVAVAGAKDSGVSYMPFAVAIPLAALYSILITQTRKFC